MYFWEILVVLKTKTSDGYEGVRQGLGHDQKNVDEKRVLEFSDRFELKIANAWFKKDMEKLVA